jgi:hypothetical protein
MGSPGGTIPDWQCLYSQVTHMEGQDIALGQPGQARWPRELTFAASRGPEILTDNVSSIVEEPSDDLFILE